MNGRILPGKPPRSIGFILLGTALFALCQDGLYAGQALTLQISNETVPAGGVAQIKVSLVQPQPVSTGRFTLDLDPAVFGDISAVGVFSASGDAYGFANVNGSHLDVQFFSGTGGVGRLRDLPMFAICRGRLKIGRRLKTCPTLGKPRRAVVNTTRTFAGSAFTITSETPMAYW